MSWLVARVVVQTAARRWIEAVADTARDLASAVGNDSRTWSITTLRAGEGDERSATCTQPPWKTVAAVACEPEVVTVGCSSLDLHLQVEARAAYQPGEIARLALPGLPPLLLSDRQPRTITVAVAADHLRDDDARVDRLVGALTELSRETDAVWAHADLAPRPDVAFTPAHRGWALEAAPIIREVIPTGAWWMALGSGHIDALGGVAAVEAAFDRAELSGDDGRRFVRTRHAPFDAAPAWLSEALAPALMAPPLDPVSAFVVVGRAAAAVGSPEPTSGVRARQLADGSIVIDLGLAAHPRGDTASSAALAARLATAYALIPNLPALSGGQAAPLYVPRFDAQRSYLRLGAGPRLSGIPVWDSGEPLGDDIQLALLANLGAAARKTVEGELAAWRTLTGARATPIEWRANRGTFAVPRSDLSRTDALLLLALALDRAGNRARRGDIHALVIAPSLTAEEVVQRWHAGSPPFR